MSKPMFILNGENNQSGIEYKGGMFPKIPNYHKSDSWFLLTEGVTDDLIVDDRTTVRTIRRGQYGRLVEVSRNTLVVEHVFDSNCSETTYTFKVRVKANVHVNDPVKFYSNIRNISVQDFLNNQFSLDVKEVTRKYSILNYNGIDEDLTRVLTTSMVSDEASGLSYQITRVMTEPNSEAMKILKERDDMAIKHKMTLEAGEIAGQNKHKTYEDALREEAAKGNMTDIEAIQRIEEYKHKGENEKLAMLLKLREEGIISDSDISNQSQEFLSTPHLQTASENQIENREIRNVDALFDEEE